MANFFIGAGCLFGLSGFLSVTNLTDFALNIAKLTRIHTLPLLNLLPAGWAYLIFGVILFIIGGALVRQESGEYWWYVWWRN
ncbi:MAG: hypothetical protein HND47_02610 [Chloroflexi bacterium]|nr:hypothetical protein [Chloroflexota bacterium]